MQLTKVAEITRYKKNKFGKKTFDEKPVYVNKRAKFYPTPDGDGSV